MRLRLAVKVDRLINKQRVDLYPDLLSEVHAVVLEAVAGVGPGWMGGYLSRMKTDLAAA